MLITTNDLNNIETLITNPQPTDIFLITDDGSDNLDCNGPQLITQINAGKLPIIKSPISNSSVKNNNISGYKYMLLTYYDESSNNGNPTYNIATVNGIHYMAENNNNFIIDWGVT